MWQNARIVASLGEECMAKLNSHREEGSRICNERLLVGDQRGSVSGPDDARVGANASHRASR